MILLIVLRSELLVVSNFKQLHLLAFRIFKGLKMQVHTSKINFEIYLEFKIQH